ncbi:hypothetical protein DIPPA_15655 [Diplonema papillatum]|nr:hypothetical protein DIPPA_15655 [Diplonema papillatum]
MTFKKRCGHNTWDNVRVNRGLMSLRCRTCRKQCRVRTKHMAQYEWRCKSFNSKKGCELGADCPKLHIFYNKQSLEERFTVHGNVVLKNVAACRHQSSLPSTATSLSDMPLGLVENYELPPLCEGDHTDEDESDDGHAMFLDDEVDEEDDEGTQVHLNSSSSPAGHYSIPGRGTSVYSEGTVTSCSSASLPFRQGDPSTCRFATKRPQLRKHSSLTLDPTESCTSPKHRPALRCPSIPSARPVLQMPTAGPKDAPPHPAAAPVPPPLPPPLLALAHRQRSPLAADAVPSSSSSSSGSSKPAELLQLQAPRLPLAAGDIAQLHVKGLAEQQQQQQQQQQRQQQRQQQQQPVVSAPPAHVLGGVQSQQLLPQQQQQQQQQQAPQPLQMPQKPKGEGVPRFVVSPLAGPVPSLGPAGGQQPAHSGAAAVPPALPASPGARPRVPITAFAPQQQQQQQQRQQHQVPATARQQHQVPATARQQHQVPATARQQHPPLLQPAPDRPPILAVPPPFIPRSQRE